MDEVINKWYGTYSSNYRPISFSDDPDENMELEEILFNEEIDED